MAESERSTSMTNAETSTTTTNGQHVALVLKDGAGNYFLVPKETLEQGRVPAEHTAEVEQLIAAGGPDEDTQGFFFPLVYGIAMTVGFAAGYFGTKAAIEGSGSGGGVPPAELQAVLNAIKAGQPKGGR
jgi:hypothetical protein